MQTRLSHRILASSLALLLLAPLSACGTPGLPNNSPQADAQNTQSSAIEGDVILPYEVSGGMRTQSAPRTQVEVRALRARVDDQPVVLSINTITPRRGETYVSYRMTGLPRIENDRVYAVELYTDDNEPLLGGVVSLQSGRSVDLDLDVRSTAVLIRAREKFNDRRLLRVNLSDIRDIERDPALVDVQLSVGSILRDVGTLTTDIIGAVFSGLAELRGRKR